MSTQTYKCSSCGGSLVFDPENGNFKCEYCLSTFDEKTIEKENVFKNEDDTEYNAKDDMTVYTCPSCGANLILSSKDIITNCYYCHTTVVMTEKASGDFKPDFLVPFSISKEKARDIFLDWAGKKKFIPNDFLSKKQIENLTGVYFPYFITDCEVSAAMQAKAENVRVWRVGDTEYTERSYFNINRSGDIGFPNILKNALTDENKNISDSVAPFDMSEAIDFSSAYLLGFQAQKRDIDKKYAEDKVKSDLNEYSKRVLMNSINGYSSVTTISVKTYIKSMDSKYVLFPVWVLTYKDKKTKRIYTFALNGQNGKIFGELPADKKKLFALFASIAIPLFAILTLAGYLL